MISKLLPSNLHKKHGHKTWKVGTITYTFGGLLALFGWLFLGDFSWSMRDRSVGPMSQWYLSEMEVPSWAFGLIVSSFPAFIGLILGPIISVKSDRHRGKWGRRIPFLMITTPFAAVGILGIAITPLIAKWVHAHFPNEPEWVVAVICFAVFWAFFEFATIAGRAVFGGLINDVVPRELLGRFYGLFRAISLIDGIAFNYWIMGHVPEYFTLILLIVGVFYGCSFMVVCFKVKEGDYPPPPPKDPDKPSMPVAFVRGAKQYVKECFTNPYYLLIFLLFTFGTLTYMPVNIFALPYAHHLGVSMDMYGKALALTFTISLCLSYFLGWLVDLFHPLRMIMICFVMYILATLWGLFFSNSQEGYLIAWVAHGVTSGCFFTTDASLGMRLYPHSKFAQFSSAGGIFTSICAIAIGPVVGSIVDMTGKMYQLIYGSGLVLAIISLLLALAVYRKMKDYGGLDNYVAPGDTEVER
ncbi:MAG: MFS transporter [Puniceicoccales bacterium]